MSHRRYICIPLLLVVLTGCAGVNWQRAFYDGLRKSEQPCGSSQTGAGQTCSRLPDYDQYEKERATLTTPVAPVAKGTERLACTSAAPYAGRPLHAALPLDTFPPTSSNGSSNALPIDLAKLLDTRADDILRQTGAPAVSAAIAIPGLGRWTSNRGLTRTTPAEPVDDATLFHWASATKPLTAVLVLQLIEEGKLHRDDRLARWYPQIPQAEFITVEHLLTHTSGLATNAVDAVGQIPQTPDALLIAAARTPSVFCPGQGASYSNTGYLLLGLVVQTVEQQPFQEVLQRRIAGPLGLKHLRALQSHEEQPTDPGAWSRIGSGNVIGQADDMLSVWQALQTGKLLPLATVRRQWAQLYPISPGPSLQKDPSTMWFGAGVMLTEWMDKQGRNRQWLGHMGGTPGANAVVLYDPTVRTYAAVALNSDVSSVAFANALLQVVEAWQSTHPLHTRGMASPPLL